MAVLSRALAFRTLISGKSSVFWITQPLNQRLFKSNCMCTFNRMNWLTFAKQTILLWRHTRRLDQRELPIYSSNLEQSKLHCLHRVLVVDKVCLRVHPKPIELIDPWMFIGERFPICLIYPKWKQSHQDSTRHQRKFCWNGLRSEVSQPFQRALIQIGYARIWHSSISIWRKTIWTPWSNWTRAFAFAISSSSKGKSRANFPQ